MAWSPLARKPAGATTSRPPSAHVSPAPSKVISSKIRRESCHSVCSEPGTQSHQPVTVLRSVTERSPKGPSRVAGTLRGDGGEALWGTRSPPGSRWSPRARACCAQ